MYNTTITKYENKTEERQIFIECSRLDPKTNINQIFTINYLILKAKPGSKINYILPHSLSEGTQIIYEDIIVNTPVGSKIIICNRPNSEISVVT